MFRLNHITALLICLFIVTISSRLALASDKPDVSNIGFVLYTKSSVPGTLNAIWIYGKKHRGTGIATGGPKEGYVGRYLVRYFDKNGDFSDEYDLVIEKIGDIYEVSWLTDDKLLAVGVGMEVENGLAVGWQH